MRGDPVHMELIVEGDASTLTAVSIFNAGQTSTRTLADDEYLHIMELHIVIEAGGDYSLVADSAAAGRYIAHGQAAEDGGLHVFFGETGAYRCPKGVVPKFAGPAAQGAERSSCIMQGYITKG